MPLDPILVTDLVMSKDCVVLAPSCPDLSHMPTLSHYKGGFLELFIFDQSAVSQER